MDIRNRRCGIHKTTKKKQLPSLSETAKTMIKDQLFQVLEANIGFSD